MALERIGLAAYLTVSTQGSTAQVDKLGRSVASLSSRLRLAGRGLHDLRMAGTAIRTGLTPVLMASSLAMGLAARNALKYDHALRRIQMVVRGSTGAASLTKQMALDPTTGATAVAAADAYLILGRAGIKAVEMTKMLPSVLRLSAVEEISAGKAATYLTNIMNAMGISFGGVTKKTQYFEAGIANVERVTSILATVANTTDTTISALAEGMKHATGQAKLMGYSLEEVAAAIGVIQERGLKSGLGGRAFSQMIAQMASSHKRGILSAAGIEVTNEDGSFVSLLEMLKRIKAATSQMNAKQVVTFFHEAFAMRGGRSVAFLNENLDAMMDKLEKISDPSQRYSLESMAKTRAQSTQALMESVRSGFGVIGIEMFGEALGPQRKNLVDFRNYILGTAKALTALRAGETEATLLDPKTGITKDMLSTAKQLLEIGEGLGDAFGTLLDVLKGIAKFASTGLGAAVVKFAAISAALTPIMLPAMWGMQAIAGLGRGAFLGARGIGRLAGAGMGFGVGGGGAGGAAGMANTLTFGGALRSAGAAQWAWLGGARRGPAPPDAPRGFGAGWGLGRQAYGFHSMAAGNPGMQASMRASLRADTLMMSRTARAGAAAGFELSRLAGGARALGAGILNTLGPIGTFAVALWGLSKLSDYVQEANDREMGAQVRQQMAGKKPEGDSFLDVLTLDKGLISYVAESAASLWYRVAEGKWADFAPRGGAGREMSWREKEKDAERLREMQAEVARFRELPLSTQDALVGMAGSAGSGPAMVWKSMAEEAKKGYEKFGRMSDKMIDAGQSLASRLLSINASLSETDQIGIALGRLSDAIVGASNTISGMNAKETVFNVLDAWGLKGNTLTKPATDAMFPEDKPKKKGGGGGHKDVTLNFILDGEVLARYIARRESILGERAGAQSEPWQRQRIDDLGAVVG